jgi:hypothetical protein
MWHSAQIVAGLLVAWTTTRAAVATSVPPAPSQVSIESWGTDAVRVRWVVGGASTVKTAGLPGALDPTPPPSRSVPTATTTPSSSSSTSGGGSNTVVVENGNIRVGWADNGELVATRVDDNVTLLRVVSSSVVPCQVTHPLHAIHTSGCPSHHRAASTTVSISMMAVTRSSLFACI